LLKEKININSTVKTPIMSREIEVPVPASLPPTAILGFLTDFLPVLNKPGSNTITTWL